ncbi:MAG: hypothetical protein ACRDKZ_09930, partial [Actinomycetota bacterium]
QMRCIAGAGGGRYYDARSAEQLADRLQRLALDAFRTFEVKGTKIQGAPEPGDAPLLDPGDYADAIARATDRWYAVALERGQSLTASTSVVGDARGRSSPFARIALRLYTPDLRSPVSARGLIEFTGASPVTVGAQSEPVGLRTSAADWSEPGVYYLRLSLLDAQELGASTYPVELTMDVQGRPPVTPTAEEESDGWVMIAAGWLLAGVVAGSAAAAAVRRIFAP